MEKPDLHFKTPLGSSQAQTFRFTSFLQGAGADFTCTISDTKNFEVESSVKAEPAPDDRGIEVAVELVFSPSAVGEFPCELIVASATAGTYKVAMYGHSIAPQPQGPHIVKAGGSVKIDFQNGALKQLDTNNPPSRLCIPLDQPSIVWQHSRIITETTLVCLLACFPPAAVFDIDQEFKFVCDNPFFTCKDGEKIAGKKKTTIGTLLPTTIYVLPSVTRVRHGADHCAALLLRCGVQARGRADRGRARKLIRADRGLRVVSLEVLLGGASELVVVVVPTQLRRTNRGDQPDVNKNLYSKRMDITQPEGKPQVRLKFP